LFTLFLLAYTMISPEVRWQPLCMVTSTNLCCNTHWVESWTFYNLHARGTESYINWESL